MARERGYLAPKPAIPSDSGKMLPRFTPWLILVASASVVCGISAALTVPTRVGGRGELNLPAVIVGTAVSYAAWMYLASRHIEGVRRAKDRLMSIVMSSAFVLALLPLVSLAVTAVMGGAARLDSDFFTHSMRNVVGSGGGALAAIIGTVLITGAATLMSVPIGLLSAIYLVEYGRGRVARAMTLLVDVMTGIPSIVAGLFAFALFALLTGDPGIRSGFGGAVALAILMIPVVVRGTEAMLRLVPNELREAALALGVAPWRVIVRIVLPTAAAGIVSSVMIAISRVIGETAPLLIISGFSTSINTDLFDGRMMTLPVLVYTQYMNQGNPAQAYIDRAWAGALTLIITVAMLNVIARLIARILAPARAR